jgi:hypothetical protein
MKKSLFTLLFFALLKITIYAQNINEKKHSSHVGNKQIDVQINDAQLAPVNYVNEDDIYQGRQKEILNNLTVRVIPDDFPKYQKGKGIKWYNEQMDNYYITHPMIITEMVRKKLLGN